MNNADPTKIGGELRWSRRIRSPFLFKDTRRVVPICYRYKSFQGKGFMGSQPSCVGSEQSVFGLLGNFTRKDTSSSVKGIFHTGRQNCGVGRKISGVMTSNNEQHIPVWAVFVSTTKLCVEKIAALDTCSWKTYKLGKAYMYAKRRGSRNVINGKLAIRKLKLSWLSYSIAWSLPPLSNSRWRLSCNADLGVSFWHFHFNLIFGSWGGDQDRKFWKKNLL